MVNTSMTPVEQLRQLRYEQSRIATMWLVKLEEFRQFSSAGNKEGMERTRLELHVVVDTLLDNVHSADVIYKRSQNGG